MARSEARVLPPLLYVFRDAHKGGDSRKPLDIRDAEGARVITGRRGLSRNPVSEAVLQGEITQNILALLNTVHMEASEDLSEQPLVRRSILNYGIQDLSRLTENDVRLSGVAADIRRALLDYEPRLDRKSVTVTRDRQGEKDENLTVRFRVQADMIASPLNVPVEFVAEADREHARFRVEGA